MHAVVLAAQGSPVAVLAERLRKAAPDTPFTERASWAELRALATDERIIVLLDAQLPVESIPALVRSIRADGSRVIVVSAIDDPRAVVPYMAAGADAALTTKDSTRRVIDQIKLAVNRAWLIRARGDG